jgi:hypothetical protein
MKKSFAVLVLFISLALSARADQLVAQFNIAGDGDLTTVASVGSVTLTLQSNGVIFADLRVFSGAIIGFGFNSSNPSGVLGHSTSADFSTPIFDDASFGIGVFSSFNSGMATNPNSGAPPVSDVTFTIGNLNEFTSLSQLTPAGGFPVNFFLETEATPGGPITQFGGNAVFQANAVPEPGSLVLLTTGVLGLAGAMRRKFLK